MNTTTSNHDARLLLDFTQKSVSPSTSTASTPTPPSRMGFSPPTFSNHSKTNNAVIQPTSTLGSPWSTQRAKRIRRSALHPSSPVTASSSATAFTALLQLATATRLPKKTPTTEATEATEAMLRAATASFNKQQHRRHQQTRPPKLGKRARKQSGTKTATKKRCLSGKKKCLLAPKLQHASPRPATVRQLPVSIPYNLISLIPELKARLQLLHDMFWRELFPLLSNLGWVHCKSTVAAAEVFVPPPYHGQHSGVRFRSIFDTLCYLSTRGLQTTAAATTGHTDTVAQQMEKSIQYVVFNLLEQRRLLWMVAKAAGKKAVLPTRAGPTPLKLNIAKGRAKTGSGRKQGFL